MLGEKKKKYCKFVKPRVSTFILAVKHYTGTRKTVGNSFLFIKFFWSGKQYA